HHPHRRAALSERCRHALGLGRRADDGASAEDREAREFTSTNRPGTATCRRCMGRLPPLLAECAIARRPSLAADDRPGADPVPRMAESTPAPDAIGWVHVDMGADALARLVHEPCV